MASESTRLPLRERHEGAHVNVLREIRARCRQNGLYDCQRFFILHFIVGRNKRAHSDGHIVALDRELTADEGLQHQMKRQLLLILGLLALPLRLARPIGHNHVRSDASLMLRLPPFDLG